MTILGVVINIGATEHVCYHPNYKSLKDIRDNLDKFDVAVLVFENFENSFFVLDLKKLFSVQDLLAFNNWEDLHQFVEHQDADWLSLYMGTAIVPTHMQINDTTSVLCPFGSFTGNQMKIFSFENGNYGDVELGDAGSPASDTTLGPTAGLNADGQHNHIWDTCVPTFLIYNIPIIISALIAVLIFK